MPDRWHLTRPGAQRRRRRFDDRALIHEYAEALTDPEYNAWNYNSNEVGDACVNYAATANPEQRQTPYAYAPTLGGKSAGTLFDQSINGNPYYTQSLT